MLIIVSRLIVSLFGPTTRAVAIFPVIFLRHRDFRAYNHLVLHERIHRRQQMEMLVIPWYLWYFIEYGIHRIRLCKYMAYKRISFEMEAFLNEGEENYLKKRKLYSFIKYL